MGGFKPVHVSIGRRARTLAAARKHIVRSIAAAEESSEYFCVRWVSKLESSRGFGSPREFVS